MLRILPVFVLLSLAGRAALADPVPRLIGILRQASDYKQRLAAALALAKRKDLRALPALIAALGDKNAIVCGVAASVLGKLGDPRAKSALEYLVGTTKSSFLRSQAKEALLALARRATSALASQRPGTRVPGGRAPGSRVPPAKTHKRASGSARTMRVTGGLGTLDSYSIQQGINARLPAATACFNKQFAVHQYLGGKVQLRFRVDTGGHVKWLLLEHSDIGSHAVETCIVAAMRAATFEAPSGGEAEFGQPLAFGGGDPVVALDPQTSVVVRQLRRHCKKLLRPERHREKQMIAPPGLLVTLYLDARGTVSSAGLSAGGATIPGEFARRFLANLRTRKLKGATRGHAKLTYSFSCKDR